MKWQNRADTHFVSLVQYMFTFYFLERQLRDADLCSFIRILLQEAVFQQGILFLSRSLILYYLPHSLLLLTDNDLCFP